jgi:hypothetical protein
MQIFHLEKNHYLFSLWFFMIDSHQGHISNATTVNFYFLTEIDIGYGKVPKPYYSFGNGMEQNSLVQIQKSNIN